MRTSVFHARRAARLAALLILTGGTLGGCGIQETDVIEAGSPAVGDLLPPREGRLLLFFFSPDDELLPVPRTVASPWLDGTAGSVRPDGSTARPEGSRGRDGLAGTPDAYDGTSAALSPLAAVTALLAGPDRAERRAGFRNAPSLARAASTADRVVTGGLTVEVELRLRVTRLTSPARDQLVCTAAYAADAQGAVSVRLVGQDAHLAPARCPVRPVPAPAR